MHRCQRRAEAIDGTLGDASRPIAAKYLAKGSAPSTKNNRTSVPIRRNRRSGPHLRQNGASRGERQSSLADLRLIEG
jgi:hypothetical protein